MNVMLQREAALFLAVFTLFLVSACGLETDSAQTPDPGPIQASTLVPADATAKATPQIPDLQSEFMDERFSSGNSPLASFDFRNHTYPLPRGWQNPDGSEITLIDGKLEAVSLPITEDMEDDEKIRRRAERRIGMSHVATRFFDADGDGQENAVVILKIETTGAAIPQIVYVYEWKDDAPKLMWHFRTGDRADGGLKDIRPDTDGRVIVELYGQDRFVLGEVETGKITGDEEQLCCPTHFTRSSYEWNGTHFIRKGDRLTLLTADPLAEPIINMGDIVNAREQERKSR